MFVTFVYNNVSITLNNIGLIYKLVLLHLETIKPRRYKLYFLSLFNLSTSDTLDFYAQNKKNGGFYHFNKLRAGRPSRIERSASSFQK